MILIWFGYKFYSTLVRNSKLTMLMHILKFQSAKIQIGLVANIVQWWQGKIMFCIAIDFDVPLAFCLDGLCKKWLFLADRHICLISPENYTQPITSPCAKITPTILNASLTSVNFMWDVTDEFPHPSVPLNFCFSLLEKHFSSTKPSR